MAESKATTATRMTDERLEGPAVIQFGDFTLNRRLRRLERNAGIVKLAMKPFEVLEFLAVHRDRPVSKVELLRAIWGNRDLDPNLVEQAIRQIRLAIEANPKNPLHLVTAPGVGYRFAAPVILGEDARTTSETDSTGASTARGSLSERGKLPWSPWAYLAAGLLSILAVVTIVLFLVAPGQPAACEVSVNTLIVKDGQGREVWKYEFSQHLNTPFYAGNHVLCHFIDLNHDGVNDVLFASKPASSGLENDTLYGFVTPSKLLRAVRTAPRQILTFKPGTGLLLGPNGDPTMNREYDEYLPPWAIVNFFSKNLSNGKVSLIVSSGMGQAPDQIAVLDSGLKKLGEYWHAGILGYGQFASYNGQERIFLGGVNNGYHSATLIAFDPNKISGTTDLSEDLPDRAPKFGLLKVGTREHLEPLGPGTETCRVIFTRTCIAKAKLHTEPYNRLVDLTVTDSRIFATIAESEKEESRLRVVYEMDRHLNLVEAAPTTEFRQRHAELERAGLLNHVFSAEELKPLIHVLPGCEFVEKRK